MKSTTTPYCDAIISTSTPYCDVIIPTTAPYCDVMGYHSDVERPPGGFETRVPGRRGDLSSDCSPVNTKHNNTFTAHARKARHVIGRGRQPIKIKENRNK